MVINANITPAQATLSIAWMGSKSSKVRVGDTNDTTVDDGLTMKNIEPAQDVFHLKMDSDGSSGNGKTVSYTQRQGAVEKLSDASSFTHVQKMYLDRVDQSLKRMQDLAAQSQDTNLSAEDIARNKKEFDNLVKGLVEVSNKDYNGVKLFDGNPRQISTLSLDLQGVNLTGDPYAKVVRSDISTSEIARQAQKDIDVALKQLSRDRQSVAASADNINQAARIVIDFTDDKESSDAMKSVRSVSSEFILNSEQALAAQANISLDPQRTIQLLN